MFYASNLPPQRLPNNKRPGEGLARRRSFQFRIPRDNPNLWRTEHYAPGILDHLAGPQSEPTPETVDEEEAEVDLPDTKKAKGQENEQKWLIGKCHCIY